MKELKVKLTFTEPILGTSPANPEIYREFIGSKSPDAATVEEEVSALGADAVAEKAMTVFPRTEDGTPFLYDYQIKGFFKDTCGGLRKVKGTTSEKIKAYKKEIDKLIFPEPRVIPLEFSGPVGECQRPLRAQTAQGERISLAMSEEIPAGATCEFRVTCLCDDHEKAVREWLDYAASPASASGATVEKAGLPGRRPSNAAEKSRGAKQWKRCEALGKATARHGPAVICHGMETRRWARSGVAKQRNSIALGRYGMEGPRIVQQCDGKAL